MQRFATVSSKGSALNDAGTAFLVTCEHGGNRVPPRYAAYFTGHRRLLQSHRGYDVGALAMAGALARGLRAPLIASTVSRLVVELNRSPGHRQMFSSIMKEIPERYRREACLRYYVPYRSRVETVLRALLRRHGRVVHISSHSFTPVLNGVVRNADVGLLYDPRRRPERELCARWQRALRALSPEWRVRRNYPYRGSDDGLTRYLRTLFPERRYSGIELEMSAAIVRSGGHAWRRARSTVVEALRLAVANA
jgi:predicted N-formylglutamate amidohydrolase